MSSKIVFRRVGEVLILVLAAGFILHFIKGNWLTVTNNIKHADWPLLAVSWIFFLLYFITRTIAWKLILKDLGSDLPLKKAGPIWFWSEFSRYIPGNIWSFLGRVYLAGKEGVPKKITLASLILEIIFLVGGATFFLGVFIALWPYKSDSDFRWFFLAAVPVIAVILSPNLLIKSLNFLLIKFKLTPIEFKITRLGLLKIFLTFFLCWLFYGLASFISMKAFVSTQGISLIWLVSGFVVAWLIGYLSFV